MYDYTKAQDERLHDLEQRARCDAAAALPVIKDVATNGAFDFAAVSGHMSYLFPAELDALLTELQPHMPGLSWAIHTDEQDSHVHLGVTVTVPGHGPVELHHGAEATDYLAGDPEQLGESIAERVFETYSRMCSVAGLLPTA